MDGFAVSTTTMSLLALTSFSFLSQPTVTMARINTIQKRSCFHWWTSLDGHLSNCLKQGIMLQTKDPYTLKRTLGLHSEVDMTFTFPATRRPIAILTATLAILTAHRAGTATAAPSPKHSWQELTGSHQTKLKLFTKQPKCSELHQPWHFAGGACFPVLRITKIKNS